MRPRAARRVLALPLRRYESLGHPQTRPRGAGRGASTATVGQGSLEVSCAFAVSAGYRVRFRAFQTSSAGHRRAHCTGA